MGILQFSILLFSRWSARYMKTRALKVTTIEIRCGHRKLLGFGRFGSARFCFAFLNLDWSIQSTRPTVL